MLHYLLGVNYLDDRLLGIVDRVHQAAALTPSQDRLAERIAVLWSQPARDAALPAVQLCGAETADKRGVAVAACRKLGCDLCVVSAQNLPADPRELEALMRLWEREAILSRAVLLLDCDELDATDAVHAHAVARFVEGVGGLVILTGRERRALRQRPLISFDVARPTVQEQRALWQQTLGATAVSLNGHVETLVAQFSLNAAGIRSAAAEIAGQPVADESRRGWATGCGMRVGRSRGRDWTSWLSGSRLRRAGTIWCCRSHSVRRCAISSCRCATAAQVYEQWGFAAKSSRGLGISALFAGASGTGKTLAAEVLANELRLDLYRIDLSQVVSKYIGETEKNLRRVFDAAEDGGAVLLFDEADALFGKRSEVKDSHDRYANIEVSYLLQRMEAYRGLAILTTNMKDALDTAFLRRIRFVVTFPFPDGAQRAEIWRRIFPAATPTDGVDVTRLARLNVTGGNIRNIALNAAFLAADAGEPVRMPHLLRAAQIEYAKLEKPLTASEVGDWV